MGQVVTPRGDPDQHDALGALVALEDLVRDARGRSADLRLVHEPGDRLARLRGHHENGRPGPDGPTPMLVRVSVGAPFPASRDRT